MLCRDVTAFGWTVLVIQVACTSDTTLSWGEGALEYLKRTNFCVYLFLQAKKIVLSEYLFSQMEVFQNFANTFANGKVLQISSL